MPRKLSTSFLINLNIKSFFCTKGKVPWHFPSCISLNYAILLRLEDWDVTGYWERWINFIKEIIFYLKRPKILSNSFANSIKQHNQRLALVFKNTSSISIRQNSTWLIKYLDLEMQVIKYADWTGKHTQVQLL